MVAGQISPNNYAKNAGQIWTGSGVEYPFLHGFQPFYTIGSTSVTGLVRTHGWVHEDNNRGSWPNLDTYPEFGINGLEGVMTSTSFHTGETLNVDNFRRWKVENGTGLYNPVMDQTYGPIDSTGKFFMHLSFLGPGEDLVTSTTDMGDEIYGTNMVAKGLRGIFGGGVFTNGLSYPNNTFGTATLEADKHSGIPMEGFLPLPTGDPLTWVVQGMPQPGPGVSYNPTPTHLPTCYAYGYGSGASGGGGGGGGIHMDYFNRNETNGIQPGQIQLILVLIIMQYRILLII